MYGLARLADLERTEFLTGHCESHSGAAVPTASASAFNWTRLD